MPADFPYLYPNSRAEARRRKETQMHEDSFRQNVACARAIEQAIRDHFHETDETLSEGCGPSVLKQYGFKRVIFVLANSLQELQESVSCKHLVSEETYQWGRKTPVPSDGYNRYYRVDTAAPLLESFIGQVKDSYQALGLFGLEHCDKTQQDYMGKVLVLGLDALKESYWTPHDQLWLATGGAGCSNGKLGRTVFATCLGDGEETRWGREDFTGVLDERYLPDWAVKTLAELQGAQQEQPEAPFGGMEMT